MELFSSAQQLSSLCWGSCCKMPNYMPFLIFILQLQELGRLSVSSSLLLSVPLKPLVLSSLHSCSSCTRCKNFRQIQIQAPNGPCGRQQHSPD